MRLGGGLVGLALSCLAADPAQAAKEEGVASDAQPGLPRVAVAEPAKPALAATVGYGFTEAQGDGDGAHHRLSLRLAAAAALLPWLNVGPVIDGRYDLHADDSGAVFDPALAIRGVASVGDLRLGAELRAWAPGAESASTVLKALSLDARALVGVSLGSANIAAIGGYRLDRSAEAGETAPRLGFGDRVALGLSDFDAVLVGVGSGIFFGNTELLVEVSGDLLVGGDAPPLLESPLRATTGVRHALSKQLSAEFLVNVSLSGRPELLPSSPLVPIEPRVSAFAGIRYAFGGEADAKPAPEAPPPPAEAVAPPVSTATDAPVEVVVVDDQGVPVENAKVSVTIAGAKRELLRDASGSYRDDHVPPGTGVLTVEAVGFEPLELPVKTQAGTPLKVEMKLTALPPPSQIRGVVRSFSGQGLAARVRVAPLGLEATTDPAGAFQIDVPPGAYEVTIEAESYESQQRQVRVDPQGVVILNADLVKKRGAK
jgi:hypothetical protein